MLEGRLKRSLKEKCPDCGKVLQLRVREIDAIEKGIEIVLQEEYICCSNQHCDYEQEVEQKRRRLKDTEV